jgi:hypothetical protein
VMTSLSIAVVTAASVCWTPDAQRNAGVDLKRSAFFGAKIGSVSDQARKSRGIDSGVGIAVEEVIKGSTAADAGFKTGDILLAVNGTKIHGPGQFVQTIGGLKAGASVAIEFRRGDASRESKVTLKGRPVETSADHEVIYGSVPSRGGRLRTIVTHPRGAGKHPALFLIQGIGLYSIDNPSGPLESYRAIIDDFTRRGFVTLWESYKGQVLAIWGTAAFVSNEDDHALIARVVNRVHPGHGTFIALDGIDHGLFRAASPRESFERGRTRQPGEFNPAIIEVCESWVEKLSTPTDDDTAKNAFERDPEGWTDLLAHAGPKLKGWVRGPVPAEAKLDPQSQWALDAATGHLVCEGNRGHEWLRWDRELGDLIFHVEWRFTPVPGKKGYNSGVYARNSADAKIWHQAQTGDASGGYLFGNTKVGDAVKRFNLSKRGQPSRVKPAGEWNTFEITCRGKEMTLWVNGAVTNRWGECEIPRGYVGLEAEGWRIEFRNVKVKTLDK